MRRPRLGGHSEACDRHYGVSMALAWLLGPEITEKWEDTDQGVRVRPVTIDTDTVAELVHIAAEELYKSPGTTNAVVSVFCVGATEWQPERELSELQVSQLSLADLGRLHIRGHGNDMVGNITASVRVDLFRKGMRFVLFNSSDPTLDYQARRRLSRKLLDDGTPRIDWVRYAPSLAAIPGLLALAAWIWALATTAVPSPLVLFGWTLTAFSIAGSYAIGHLINKRSRTRFNTFGHRILGQTRAETKAARANRKRDAVVAVITAVLSIAATLIGAALLGAFGLKS